MPPRPSRSCRSTGVHRPDRLPRLLRLQAPALAARDGLLLRPPRSLGRARAAQRELARGRPAVRPLLRRTADAGPGRAARSTSRAPGSRGSAPRRRCACWPSGRTPARSPLSATWPRASRNASGCRGTAAPWCARRPGRQRSGPCGAPGGRGPRLGPRDRRSASPSTSTTPRRTSIARRRPSARSREAEGGPMVSASRIVGRATARIDRLDDRRFALLSILPGALFVGLIVVPPILAAFGLELVPGRAGPRREHAVRRASATSNDSLADEVFLASIPRTLIFAVATTALTLPLALGTALAAQSRVPRRRRPRHRDPAAVGRRARRHRALLELHLQRQLRDGDRLRPDARPDRSADRLAPGHGHGRPIAIVATAWRLGAAAGDPAACRAQDDPADALPRRPDGRRDAWQTFRLHHAARHQATRCSSSPSCR